MNSYEKKLLDHINRYRSKRRLPPLVSNSALRNLAKKHSKYMQKSDSLNHDGFNERVQKSGRSCCTENVGWNYPTAEGMFTGWKNSPMHNKNMVHNRIRSVGIAQSGPYVTFFACD